MYGYEKPGSGDFYMTRAVDQQGFVTQFNYGQDGSGNLILSTVADQAGNTLYTLGYTNSTLYSLVSSVSSRFGQTVSISYYEDAGYTPHIARIQDAASLVSAVSYNTLGWPQTLVTPYGSNLTRIRRGRRHRDQLPLGPG